MCFSSGGSAKKIAKQQRADEVARQDRIKQGMADIASIFDGTATGINPASAYDPSQTYYLADGTEYRPGNSGPSLFGVPLNTTKFREGQGGGRFGDAFRTILAGQTPEELIRQGKLFTGVQRSGGFDDAYYAGRRKAYIDYAMPEVDRQYGDARDDMIYALSRSGLTRSGAGIDKNADLSRQFDRARTDVANQGLNVENTARSNVENVRSGLVAELNATGDNQAAAAAAVRQAQNLTMPVGFSPLGEMFANFASGVSQIGANSRNDFSGFLGGGKPLFGSSGGSARVVGG